MYSFQDLKWVKNVKRDDGNWAYADVEIGQIFKLHWSKKYKNNVMKPKTGDLILLFQAINNSEGIRLTHIVTPIDEIKYFEKENTKHPLQRQVGLVSKANPINNIKRFNNITFEDVKYGACNNINLLIEPTSRTENMINKLKSQIWSLFKPTAETLKEYFSFISQSTFDEEVLYLEGMEKYKLQTHKYYERNSEVIQLAKQRAKQQNKLYCEICGFDFSRKYGDIGEDFIECHHKIPIATGGIRKTKIDDLSLVCSNCHRMLHRKINDNYLSVDELSKIINNKSRG
ncbi:MAG: HNH endonuclease [Bacteroidetes bacterium]|nr:HNH endonuclease [Bacteroidota bacterium]